MARRRPAAAYRRRQGAIRRSGRKAGPVAAWRRRWWAPVRLVRCKQTAEILAAGAADEPKVVELDELRPGSDLEGLLRWTAAAGPPATSGSPGSATPPTSDRLAAALIGQPEGQIRFAKGAVAAIRFDGPPAAGGGELQWLVTAKAAGAAEANGRGTSRFPVRFAFRHAVTLPLPAVVRQTSKIP